jgi:hypothetical protein
LSDMVTGSETYDSQTPPPSRYKISKFQGQGRDSSGGACPAWTRLRPWVQSPVLQKKKNKDSCVAATTFFLSLGQPCLQSPWWVQWLNLASLWLSGMGTESILHPLLQTMWPNVQEYECKLWSPEQKADGTCAESWVVSSLPTPTPSCYGSCVLCETPKQGCYREGRRYGTHKDQT